MSALHAAYLADIIEAHREGLRVLRELIATATDPAERRRLAIALVRARPVKDPDPDEEMPSTLPGKRTEPSADQQTAPRGSRRLDSGSTCLSAKSPFPNRKPRRRFHRRT
ncbi:MAG: hypothetical protein QM783_02725 [Phycisphaerales bacterium]